MRLTFRLTRPLLLATCLVGVACSNDVEKATNDAATGGSANDTGGAPGMSEGGGASTGGSGSGDLKCPGSLELTANTPKSDDTSFFEIPVEEASSHRLELIVLPSGSCPGTGMIVADALGGAGGLGGAPGTEWHDLEPLEVDIGEFIEGTGQTNGKVFRVDAAPALVRFYPQLSDGYTTAVDGGFAGNAALVDLETGAIVQIFHYVAWYNSLL